MQVRALVAFREENFAYLSLLTLLSQRCVTTLSIGRRNAMEYVGQTKAVTLCDVDELRGAASVATSAMCSPRDRTRDGTAECARKQRTRVGQREPVLDA